MGLFWASFFAQLFRPLVGVVLVFLLAIPLWVLRRHFPRSAPWLWRGGWFPLYSIGYLMGRLISKKPSKRARARKQVLGKF